MVDIIKCVEEPKDKEKGLYKITFIGMTEDWTAHMTKNGYDSLLLRIKLLKCGCKEEDLDDYAELIHQERMSD